MQLTFKFVLLFVALATALPVWEFPLVELEARSGNNPPQQEGDRTLTSNLNWYLNTPDAHRNTVLQLPQLAAFTGAHQPSYKSPIPSEQAHQVQAKNSAPTMMHVTGQTNPSDDTGGSTSNYTKACQACYDAKIKCEYPLPCKNCRTLGVSCDRRVRKSYTWKEDPQFVLKT